MSRPRAPDPRHAYDRGAWSEGGDEPPADGDHAAPDAEIDLTRLSTAEIVAELRRRESRLGRLVEKRRRLAEELARIEKEIRAIKDVTPAAAPARRGPVRSHVAVSRPRNSLSLADAVAAEIETDEVVGPAEVAKRVLRNGYQTNAKNFTLLVNGTLRKDDRFERVGRGSYRRLSSAEVEARRAG